MYGVRCVMYGAAIAGSRLPICRVYDVRYVMWHTGDGSRLPATPYFTHRTSRTVHPRQYQWRQPAEMYLQLAVCFRKKSVKRLLRFIPHLQADMFAEIHLPQAIPFKHRFLSRPGQGKVFKMGRTGWIGIPQCQLTGRQKFVPDSIYFGHGYFYINAHPALCTDNSSCIITTV